MSQAELLTRLGLSKNESKIYLSLIQSGPATVSNISKNTGIHRPIIYKHLPELQDRGLVAVSKKGKLNYYLAESPDNLNQLIERTHADLHQMIPGLMDSYQAQGKKPVLKFYQGRKGLGQIYMDIVNTLKRGEVFYRYSSSSDVKRGKSFLPEGYREKRDAKQIERFMITGEAMAKKKKQKMERAIKVVLKEFGLFEYDVTLIIYANKMAILDDVAQVAYVIENEALAKFQTTLFKLLWAKL